MKNVALETMMEHRSERAQVSIYVDSERDEVSATKMIMKAHGYDINAMSKDEAVSLSDKMIEVMAGIHIATPKNIVAAVAHLRRDRRSKQICVYARLLKSDITNNTLLAMIASDVFVLTSVNLDTI